MSDENVGGLVELVAKWRLRMAHADAMEKSCADEANKNWWSGVSQQAEECADELEAALSVSESKICGLAERMSELIYRAERSGYVVIKHDEIRRISTALSAHGQPVVDGNLIAKLAWKHLQRKDAESLTFERSSPLVPQVSIDTPTVELTNFAKALLAAALTGADHEP